MNSPGITQTSHFSFTTTTNPYAVVITSVTIDGVPIEAGDEVAAVTPAGLVVGAGVFSGTFNLGFSTWPDDDQTTEVDGFVTGEAISFRIWDASEGVEINNVTPTFITSPPNGDGTFGSGAFSTVSLDGFSVIIVPLLLELNLPDSIVFNEDEKDSLLLETFINSDTPFELLEWNIINSNNVTTNIENGFAIFTPELNWFGEEDIIFSVTDTVGTTKSDTVLIKVLPVNDPPIILSTPVTSASVEVFYVYNVSAGDVDNSTLIFSLNTSPDWLSINQETGVITGTPGINDFGVFPIEVGVSDNDTTVIQTYSITVEKPTAPLKISHNPVASGEAGVPIQIIVTGSESAESIILSYKNFGSTEFNSIEMVNISDSTWIGTIPQMAVNSFGIEYYVLANDGSATISLPALITNPYPITVINAISETKYEIPKLTYTLISVPMNLNEKNPSTVFSELGEQNNSTWKIFSLENDTTFLENPDITTGKGYWLSSSMSISLNAQGSSINPNENFEIDLQPGWHIIGNPFAFDLYWKDFEIKSANGSVNINSEEASEYIRQIYWVYADSSQNNINDGEYIVNTGSFDLTNKLETWRGYLIKSLKDFKLILKYQENISPSFVKKNYDYKTAIDWKVQLIASGKSFIDKSNYFGVSAEASDNYDKLDIDKPPFFSNEVNLYFLHSDWGSNSGKYSHDFRQPNTDITWDFVVQGEAEIIELSWLFHGYSFGGIDLLIKDKATNEIIDLKKTSAYKFNNKKAKPRKFEIIFSVGETGFEQKIPDNFDLLQNYPNPFNNQTIIKYQVKEFTMIKIEILNIAGQNIVTLANDYHQPGNYEIIWKGQNEFKQFVSSGVYFFVLKYNNKIIARKLMLMK